MKRTFDSEYPLITNIFKAYIRPDVDTANLLITLHTVMKDSPPAMAMGLVEEFSRLTEDIEMNNADIVQQFNEEVPKEYRVMVGSNTRQLLRTLSEYVTYLYEIEGVRGSKKWAK